MRGGAPAESDRIPKRRGRIRVDYGRDIEQLHHPGRIAELSARSSTRSSATGSITQTRPCEATACEIQCMKRGSGAIQPNAIADLVDPRHRRYLGSRSERLLVSRRGEARRKAEADPRHRAG